MNKRCLTTEEIIRRLTAYSLTESERRRLDEHLDKCPKCQAAFERIGRSLAEMIASWSDEYHKCPTFEQLYNTAFDLPGGLEREKLEEHLKTCSDCKEEYELITACPSPDTEAPADYKVPDALVNATIETIKGMIPKPQKTHIAAKDRIESIKRRSLEFIERLRLEATVCFMELAPVQASRGPDKLKNVQGGKYYFILASDEPQHVTIKLLTKKGSEYKVISKTEILSPGAFEVVLEPAVSYYLEAKDENGKAFKVDLIRSE